MVGLKKNPELREATGRRIQNWFRRMGDRPDALAEGRATLPKLTDGPQDAKGKATALARDLAVLERREPGSTQALIDTMIGNRLQAVDSRTMTARDQVRFLSRLLRGGQPLRPAQIEGAIKRLAVADKQLTAVLAQSEPLRARTTALTLAAQRSAGRGGADWAVPDKLNLTGEWEPVKRPESPFVMRRRGRIKALLLNSMGGSMARLSKGLMLYHNIEADCMIGAYYPRRHMVYPHETNVFGVFSHQEWRDYLNWAIAHYDVVQSTTFPLAKGVAECYDWLTDTLGKRHIWRETGFVHHLLRRDDVLPLGIYQSDLQTDKVPNPEQFLCRTFERDEQYFYTRDVPVFYSSPEKGAYMSGTHTQWLPSMREPEEYRPQASDASSGQRDRPLVYVPHHQRSMFKGLNEALEILKELQANGAQFDLITPENATQIFPDLADFKDEDGDEQKVAAYPVPNHMMPELFRRVDLVVDQFVMGCYGNTGIEAMFCAKPVIGQKRFGEVADAPVWDVKSLDEFGDRFMELLNSPDQWDALGAAGRDYAMRVHSPEAVSRIAAQTYEQILDEARNEV